MTWRFGVLLLLSMAGADINYENEDDPKGSPLKWNDVRKCMKEKCSVEFIDCIFNQECVDILKIATSPEDDCFPKPSDICPTKVCPSSFLSLWNCHNDHCFSQSLRAAVVNYKEILSAEERDSIRRLKAIIDQTVDPEVRAFGATENKIDVKGHNCTYLNRDFLTEMPEIFERLQNLAKNAIPKPYRVLTIKLDEESLSEYILTRVDSELNIETIKSATLRMCKSILSILHSDTGSVITIVAMLSDEKEYNGGILQTRDLHCGIHSHPMRLGDAHIYRSQQTHRVLPVSAGIRQVLVVEFWLEIIEKGEEKLKEFETYWRRQFNRVVPLGLLGNVNTATRRSFRNESYQLDQCKLLV
ncbi:hypothetical protein AAMO2058_000926800 [Amorphochlora amoebiformis]